MPFSLDRFVALRPYLFHLTYNENLPGILEHRRLISARQLTDPLDFHVLAKKRAQQARVRTNRGRVTLRDQAPLAFGNVDLSPNFFREDLLNLLNGNVYFWPGANSITPVTMGRNHFRKYRNTASSVMIFRTEDLLRMNGPARFCRYNSGAPRCSGGRKSPRGPETFQTAEFYTGTAATVKEVTWVDSVQLPAVEDIRPVSEFLDLS